MLIIANSNKQMNAASEHSKGKSVSSQARFPQNRCCWMLVLECGTNNQQVWKKRKKLTFSFCICMRVLEVIKSLHKMCFSVLRCLLLAFLSLSCLVSVHYHLFMTWSLSLFLHFFSSTSSSSSVATIFSLCIRCVCWFFSSVKAELPMRDRYIAC